MSHGDTSAIESAAE